jgi:hypothetical protein
MRGFLATFRMGCKYLWTNPVSVVVLTTFPILLILVLGSALRGYIAPETSLDPAPVAVAADPGGPLGAFLQSGEIARFLAPEFTDETQARALLESGDACAAVLERGGEITVLRLPGGGGLDSLLTEVALSSVGSYKSSGAAAAAAAMRGGEFPGLPEAPVQDMALGGRVPDAMDYYAVTMLVTILLYTGMNGMDLFGKSLLGDTGSRVRLAPVSGSALAGGLLAASTVTSYLQGMVTFIFSGLVYGVHWGERIPLVLLALLAVVLFAQALCILLVALLRRYGPVMGMAQALFFVMTFVSKGYSKMNFGAAEKAFAYVPNALAHTVIFGAVYGGNEGKMMLSLALLFGMGAVLFVLAFLLGRRRLA